MAKQPFYYMKNGIMEPGDPITFDYKADLIGYTTKDGIDHPVHVQEYNSYSLSVPNQTEIDKIIHKPENRAGITEKVVIQDKSGRKFVIFKSVKLPQKQLERIESRLKDEMQQLPVLQNKGYELETNESTTKIRDMKDTITLLKLPATLNRINELLNLNVHIKDVNCIRKQVICIHRHHLELVKESIDIYKRMNISDQNIIKSLRAENADIVKQTTRIATNMLDVKREMRSLKTDLKQYEIKNDVLFKEAHKAKQDLKVVVQDNDLYLTQISANKNIILKLSDTIETTRAAYEKLKMEVARTKFEANKIKRVDACFQTDICDSKYDLPELVPLKEMTTDLTIMVEAQMDIPRVFVKEIISDEPVLNKIQTPAIDNLVNKEEDLEPLKKLSNKKQIVTKKKKLKTNKVVAKIKEDKPIKSPTPKIEPFNDEPIKIEVNCDTPILFAYGENFDPNSMITEIKTFNVPYIMNKDKEVVEEEGLGNDILQFANKYAFSNLNDNIIGTDANLGVSLLIPNVPRLQNDSQELPNMAIANDWKFQMFQCFNACDKEDINGNLPIHNSVLSNDLFGVKQQCAVLSAKNLSLDIENSHGFTPLQLSILNAVHPNIIATLIEKGADCAKIDEDGNNLFHLAVIHSNSDILPLVAIPNIDKQKQAINAYNYEGVTPLIICAIKDQHLDADILIKFGADLDLRDRKSGRTALFHAVSSNSVNSVQLLLKNGADKKVRSFLGTNAQDVASELESVQPSIKYLLTNVVDKTMKPEKNPLHRAKATRTKKRADKQLTIISKKVKLCDMK